MRPLLAGLATIALAFATTTVDAQQQKDACYDIQEGQIDQNLHNAYYNAQSTDTWRQLLQNADGQLMGQLAGVYYAERPSPDGVYLNRVYRSFEPNGLFQYQDQTCGNIQGIACSQNQGTGEWRATTWSDGSIYMMMRFSDLVRTSACAGQRVQMQGNIMYDEFGGTWQRVR